jgi:hypothetical protein
MWKMRRYQPSRNVRLLALVILLFSLMASYVLMLRHFNVFELPGERQFGAVGPVEPAGEVYLEPIDMGAAGSRVRLENARPEWAWSCLPAPQPAHCS